MKMVKLKTKNDFSISDFMTVSEFAKTRGISKDTVTFHARKNHWVVGDVLGAVKFEGSQEWLMHKDAARLPTVYARKGGRPKGKKDGYKRKKYGKSELLTKKLKSRPKI
jgi:hypothetical protein